MIPGKLSGGLGRVHLAVGLSTIRSAGMRKRIGIVMLGVLAIGTIWSLGYDWKITAILYATAVALIVYLGVALWLIFGGEEISEKKPAITTEGEVKTDAETAKPEGLPQKRKPRRGSRSPRARS